MNTKTKNLIEAAEEVIREMKAQNIGSQWRKLDRLIEAITEAKEKPEVGFLWQ
jgi:hypothetical protein